MRTYTLLIGILIALGLAGCGGSDGGSSFSPVVTVVVTAGTSGAIADADLVIVPRRGAITASNSCSLVEPNFCDAVLKNTGERRIEFEFRASSASQTDPYYAYIENMGGTDRSYRVIIYIDGAKTYDEVGTVKARDWQRVAWIYRDDAQLPEVAKGEKAFASKVVAK